MSAQILPFPSQPVPRELKQIAEKLFIMELNKLTCIILEKYSHLNIRELVYFIYELDDVTELNELLPLAINKEIAIMLANLA